MVMERTLTMLQFSNRAPCTRAMRKFGMCLAASHKCLCLSTLLLTYISVMVMGLHSTCAHAQSSTHSTQGNNPPNSTSARAWIQALRSSGQLTKVLETLPRQIALVHTLGSSEGRTPPLLASLRESPEAKADLGFYELLNATELSLALRVGEGLSGGATRESSAQSKASKAGTLRETFENLERVSSTQALIFAPSDGKSPWHLLMRDEDGKAKSPGLGLLQEVSAPPPPQVERGSPLNSNILMEWLGRTRGFNSVVLDIKGGFALVLGPSSILKRGAQGVSLRAKPGQARIDPGQDNVTGVLQCVDSDSTFGVFEILVGATGNTTGTHDTLSAGTPVDVLVTSQQ